MSALLELPVWGARGYPSPPRTERYDLIESKELNPLGDKDFVVRCVVPSLKDPSTDAIRARLEKEGVVTHPESLGTMSLTLTVPAEDEDGFTGVQLRAEKYELRDRLSHISFNTVGILAARPDAPYAGEPVTVGAHGWFPNGGDGAGAMAIRSFIR